MRRYAIVYRICDDRDTVFYSWLTITLALSAVYLNGWLPFLPRTGGHDAALGAAVGAAWMTAYGWQPIKHRFPNVAAFIVMLLRFAMKAGVAACFIGLCHLIYGR